MKLLYTILYESLKSTYIIKIKVQAGHRSIHVIDKSLLGLLVAGIPYMFDRAGLDIAQGK